MNTLPGWTNTAGDHLEAYLTEAQTLLSGLPPGEIWRIVGALLEAQTNGRRIYVLGNGGSASTASHLACDLAKSTIVSGHSRLSALALTDNMAVLTAWGNDSSYKRVFAEQLLNLLEPGDVVIAISASGNSPNVLAAVDTARMAGAHTVALTGFGGGAVQRMADMCVVVPSYDYGLVEGVHSVLAHTLTYLLRLSIEGKRDPGTEIAKAARAQVASAVGAMEEIFGQAKNRRP